MKPSTAKKILATEKAISNFLKAWKRMIFPVDKYGDIEPYVPVFIVLNCIAFLVGLTLQFGSIRDTSAIPLSIVMSVLTFPFIQWMVLRTIYWFIRSCFRKTVNTVKSIQTNIETIAARPEDWTETRGRISMAEKRKVI